MNRVDRSWGLLRALIRGRATTTAAMIAALVSAVALPVRAAEPLIVISPTASGSTTICDTDCSICTVGSGECIQVGEEDLALCRPTSTGLPITKCDWSLFLKGTAANLQINQQIRALDIDVNPSGVGLPEGRGTVTEGAATYAAKCASCHGQGGENGKFDRLVGRDGGDTFAFAKDARLVRTIGNYWPYASTLYDYTARSMPFSQPGTLTPNEVYGLVAYLLNLNEIVPENAVMDAASLP